MSAPMRRNVLIIAAIYALLTSAACAPASRYKLTTLPSGQRVKILNRGVGPIYSNTTHKVLGLMFSYETDISITDIPKLAREADSIFPYVRELAEHNGYDAVVLSANAAPTGFGIHRTGGYRFIYKRDDSGGWSRVGDPGASNYHSDAGHS